MSADDRHNRRTISSSIAVRPNYYTALYGHIPGTWDNALYITPIMSSGNPFRASLALNQAAPSPVPRTSSGTPSSTPEARNQDGDVLEHAVPSPLRTKKQVRIESSTVFIPPHSDVQDALDSASGHPVQASTRDRYADSPPLAAPAGYSNANVNADGLYTREPGRGREMTAQNTLASSGRAPDTRGTTVPASIAPANPFSKTLASIEPLERGSADGRTATERAAQGKNRASLDVESFKNLLMTGRPSPRQPGQPLQTPSASSLANAPIFESSSSTDTSSISRQSFLEPAHEPASESPRTSYEMPASEEDERALVSEHKKEKKKPPPAPKHRHGKLVSSRQPQTVSFDGFAATGPVVPSPPLKSKESSDVHKPLPPTPVMSPTPLHISTQDIALDGTSTASQRISEPPSTSESLQPQKRLPPPIPLARRQSQLRNTTMVESRSRSSSSLTISSQYSLDGAVPSPAQNINDPMSSLKSPPPPPPSRHGARLANIGTSSADPSTTEVPQRSISVRTIASSHGPSSSRRSTLESESSSPVVDVGRTASISSKRNSLRAISGESIGSVMPPPPPPPRRRQSNRSSLDLQRPNKSPGSPTESRRTSTEHRRTSTDSRNVSTENRRPSVDSKRRTSVASESSLRHAYAPADERSGSEFPLYSPNEEAENTMDTDVSMAEPRSGSNNILDDMEKFQREIDELRIRFK